MLLGDALHMRPADVPIVVVIGDLDTVHSLLNDDVLRVIPWMAIVPEQSSTGQIQFNAVIAVERAARWPDVDFLSRNDEYLAGEVLFYYAMQLHPPMWSPVIGYSYPVQTCILDVHDHGLGDLRCRRFESKHFADMGVKIQTYLHLNRLSPSVEFGRTLVCERPQAFGAIFGALEDDTQVGLQPQALSQ